MPPWRHLRRAAAARLAQHFPSAVALLPSVSPLPTRRLSGAGQAGELLVCLPGISDFAEDFARAGFADAARQSGWAAEVVAADAHFGYYARRTLLDRLRQDLILPARDAGRGRVWLAGVSMGGLGALLYARHHPEDVAGVIALAPYLGEADLVREIAAAGGARAWRPGERSAGTAFPLRDLWAWLRDAATPGRPAIHLACGAEDRFAPANRLLGALLPADRVLIAPGGHDWRTWRRLWAEVLARRGREAGLGGGGAGDGAPLSGG